jgi:hypothetical protein
MTKNLSLPAGKIAHRKDYLFFHRMNNKGFVTPSSSYFSFWVQEEKAKIAREIRNK